MIIILNGIFKNEKEKLGENYLEFFQSTNDEGIFKLPVERSNNENEIFKIVGIISFSKLGNPSDYYKIVKKDSLETKQKRDIYNLVKDFIPGFFFS
jgi:hypothetical protein